MSAARNLIFLSRRAPHGSIHAQEALDAVLMASAFEQHIELLFLDDGVWQLLAGQAPEAAGLKNFTLALRALEMHGVEDVYAERESLQLRGIDARDLLLPVTVLDTPECARRLAAADRVLSF